MAKISTYSLADEPLQLSDRLIGTEAPRPIPSSTPLATRNFSLGELLQLFSQNFPAASLQAVLNTGNTATQNITLIGNIESTSIEPTNIKDILGSEGATFQFLSKAVGGINWVDLPISNLQDILNTGNTAIQDLNLFGNLSATRITPVNIQDDVSSIGLIGQVLSKSASGIRWINIPSSFTAGLNDVLLVGNTATNDINLTGNIYSTLITPVDIKDNNSSIGTNGQVLTKKTVGFEWEDIPFPSLSGYVPYTGATQDVNLGSNSLSTEKVFLYDAPNDNYGSVHFTDGNFHIEDADNHPLFVVENGFLQIHKEATIQSNLFTTDLTETRDHYLPDESGTIALTSDIPAPITIDAVPTDGSSNAVSSNGVFDALATKQNTLTNPITGTGASGQVAFFNGATTQIGDSGLFWDNTNKRLGVGTNVPATNLTIQQGNQVYSPLDLINFETALGISSNSALISGMDFKNFNSVGQVRLMARNDANDYLALNSFGSSAIGTLFGTNRSNANSLFSVGSLDQTKKLLIGTFNNGDVILGTNNLERLRVLGTNGNTGIGTTLPNARLDVRAQGALSTDIAFRVRNSADTFDIIRVNGIGEVFVGLGAGRLNTGLNNSFFGFQAGFFNTTGANNSFFGQYAGFSNTTGANNAFFGFQAGLNNTTGANNAFFGQYAGVNNTTGVNNAFFGQSAGRFIADGTTANTISNNSLFIGFNSKALANNQTNQIVIGHDAIGAGSNTATIGNTSIVDTVLRGRVNIQQYATGSRPAYVKGALIYDSTLSKLVVGGATGWEVVTSL
jgi:hypothetical protein